jgi:hypothetical protein
MIRMFRCLLLLIVLAPVQVCSAQTFDRGFAAHLMEQRLTSEAISYFTFSLSDSTNHQHYDTLHMLMGNIFFDQQQHIQANDHYKAVSDFFTGKFIVDLKRSISLTSLNRKQEAIALLSQAHPADSLEMQIVHVFISAVLLLEKDFQGYLLADSSVQFNSYIYDDVRTRLKYAYTHRLKEKRKSPFLAGLYSAVIPGAGKVYAGKPYEGLATFFQTGALGAIALENYLKAGPGSGRFIAFGGLFGLFYVGNIWGSALAVKVEQQQSLKQFNDEIIRNMYITIRNYKG